MNPRTAIISIIAIMLMTAIAFTLQRNTPMHNASATQTTNEVAANISANANTAPATNNAVTPPAVVNASTPVPVPTVALPIADFYSRVTKKPFGIYITPKTSPVQPEKFTGYHTGADAETTSAEKNTDLPISAIADGKVVFAGHVNGYGGVIMIRHTVETETVTALYGHLRITSFSVKVGQAVTVGQKIAVLGTGFSSETDGERKHLHLGIIKGATINYKGYVQTKSALGAWEDPVGWLTRHHSASS